jgi:hypothetical protein
MVIKNLPEGVHFLPFTEEKISNLWYFFQGAKGIFDDATRGDIRIFLQALSRKDTIWLELDDELGVLYATEVIPGLSANVHIAFFDRKLKEKTPIVIQCLAWLVNVCELEKVNASLPDFTHVARKYVQELGFSKEGIVRRYSRSNGQLYDQYLYGILKEEVLTNPLLNSILE